MNASVINYVKMASGLSRVAKQSLPDTCAISRRVSGAWTDVATGVACRVELPLAYRLTTEQDIATRTGSVEDAQRVNLEVRELVLPSGQDIEMGDRVLYQTLTYEVKGVVAPLSFELYRRAIIDVSADWLP